MDITLKKWHKLHTQNIRKRENTRIERLKRRKLDLVSIRSKHSMRMHMKVPQVMSLFENYEETIQFINEISESIFKQELFVFLDFSQCKKISSETCVVLAAEIERCTRKIPRSVLGSYPQYAGVYHFLNELGFFHLLGIRSSKPTFDDLPEVDVVRLQSGQDNPEGLIKGIKELFYSADGIQPHSPYSGKIYRALTEAMANAVEHAYPDNFKKENTNTCMPIWWRAGFKLNDKNTVLMILYDQGVGMPNTLKTNWKEKIEELASTLAREPFDSEKLALAMEKGRSSTQVEGRGQGSYDIQKLIRESSRGTLSIFSYRGKYIYHNDNQWHHESLPLPLNGTLIVWQICLNALEREPNEEKSN
ncbi:MAG: hypothetical protein L6Q57_00385 [Alphaproteobacteria bacterium]|nr:hypothetical protein [Alphaproteobacteria bacterium]